MFEKVNPSHPDKVADRIAGALVDLAYTKEANPRIAVEVLIGHGTCHIIAETSVHISDEEAEEIVKRIGGELAVDYEELLRVEIEALQEMDFDPMLTGFDEAELAELFGPENPDEVEDDDFDLTAALEKAAFVERGDIWTVGRHRLMCGDATSAEDVETLMEGKKANLMLTDPPYGVSFESSSGLTIKNDSIKGDKFYQFLYDAFCNMKAHMEKGGSAYCLLYDGTR